MKKIKRIAVRRLEVCEGKIRGYCQDNAGERSLKVSEDGLTATFENWRLTINKQYGVLSIYYKACLMGDAIVKDRTKTDVCEITLCDCDQIKDGDYHGDFCYYDEPNPFEKEYPVADVDWETYY